VAVTKQIRDVDPVAARRPDGLRDHFVLRRRHLASAALHLVAQA
jgi:hypothetical protein